MNKEQKRKNLYISLCVLFIIIFVLLIKNQYKIKDFLWLKFIVKDGSKMSPSKVGF